jgi:hypothetical protein
MIPVMPSPWVTPQDILKRIANWVGGKDPSTLDPKFLEDAELACRMATSELRGILAIKGYTPAQVEAWDEKTTYSERQAIFCASTLISGLADYDKENAKTMDCREFLAMTPAILIDGVAVAPSADNPIGGVGYGTLTGVRRIRQDCAGMFRDVGCRRCRCSPCRC